MRAAGSLGEIITFYSFKGGTGRTMALANIAYLLALAESGKGVLMVDWDLEAPGLHRYFRGLVENRFPRDRAGKQFDQWPGLIDLFLQADEAVGTGSPEATFEQAKAVFAAIPLERFILETDVPSLFLLKAGRFDDTYSATVSLMDWENLHSRSPWLFRAFAELLAERFQYVLIDSRTGITDSGGICTSILPGTLVMVFTPNRQSLLGAVDMARSAARYRKDSDDLRPLRIFPLVSRIEAAEPVLRDLWRLGNLEQDVPGYQPAFEMLFTSIYALPQCNLDGYFSEIQIQHVPRFAYGEEIAARLESGDRLSLTRSFTCFLKWLRTAALPWEQPEEAPGSPERDETWRAARKAFALEGLKQSGARGFLETSFFLSKPLPAAAQKRLIQAARAAQIPGIGWPIGAVLSTSPESRPRPTADGVEAEIIDRRSKSYDYWSLREDGSFYFFRNLEEEPEYLLADDRLERVVELLLYCKRLYSFLEVEESVRVRISTSYGGLSGRALGWRMPDAPEILTRLTGTGSVDEVHAEIVLDLPRIQPDIIELATKLTQPVFSLFDFYELPAVDYQRLIRHRLKEWGFGVQERPSAAVS